MAPTRPEGSPKTTHERDDPVNVLLINGSPNKEGCTFTALDAVAGILEQNGIDTEIYQIGVKPVYGCTACGQCARTKRCVLEGDPANEMIDLIAAADGLVVGSPVYYAGPNGALCALLDRVFYAGAREFKGKPAAAVVSCRRGGSTAALDRLNKYFTISQMPVVSSQYWNMVHGNDPEEVRRDEEGLQIMRTLGYNMAYLLKAMAAAGPQPGNPEKRLWTNFIRE